MGRKAVRKKRNPNQKRRQKYLEKLMPIFYEYGLKELSMDDICSKLDVSKATLYNYFATKEEMVAGILTHVLGEIGQFEKIIADKQRSFLDRYFESITLLTRSVAGVSNIFLEDVQVMYPTLWKQITDFRDYSATVLQSFYEEGKQLDILSGQSTEILVLFDRLFFDALTEPKVLKANNLTIQQAFHEYFTIKCFGMLKRELSEEMRTEVKMILADTKI